MFVEKTYSQKHVFKKYYILVPRCGPDLASGPVNFANSCSFPLAPKLFAAAGHRQWSLALLGLLAKPHAMRWMWLLRWGRWGCGVAQFRCGFWRGGTWSAFYKPFQCGQCCCEDLFLKLYKFLPSKVQLLQNHPQNLMVANNISQPRWPWKSFRVLQLPNFSQHQPRNSLDAWPGCRGAPNLEDRPAGFYKTSRCISRFSMAFIWDPVETDSYVALLFKTF